jgi:uncharacterized lipoprotein YbaY
MRVRGTVAVKDVRTAVRDAIVRVRLLDVSRADVAATTIAETAIPSHGLEPSTPVDIPFALDAPELDPHRSYALAAHVDVGGTGEVGVEDYITTRHIPVSPRDADRAIEVPVQAVR